MTERRGLIFWALGLHSFPCYTCRRDVLWRQTPPLACRWCGGLAIDVPGILDRAMGWVAAFTDKLRKLGAAMASTSDQFEALGDAVRSLGYQAGADLEAVFDETPLLTRVDIPPEQA